MSELRPAAFLDRDGVLNVDHDYVATVERFEWVPGAIEAVRWLNENGYLVIVVTNQSGIARGLFTLDDFESLMNWAQSELAKHGARIDAWYVCPHHPTEGSEPFVLDCECRKPKPGLFVMAMSDFSIDKERSFSIGDKMRDIEAAAKAGIHAELFLNGNLADFVKELAGRTRSSFI